MSSIRMRVFGIVLLLCMALMTIACPAPPPTATDQADLRVFHMSYDGPAVAVFVDGAKVIESLAYGDSSAFAKVATGERQIKVTQADDETKVLIDAKQTFEKDKSYTVIAYENAANIKPIVLGSERQEKADKVLIRVIHAAEAPSVDIKAGTPDSTPVFANLEKGNTTEYKELDPGTVSFVITAAGDSTAVVSFEEINLEAGKLYTVVARGTLDATDSYNFGVRVFIDNGDGKTSLDLTAKTPAPADTGKVRVLHMSYDAPDVDIAVDGTVAIPKLAYSMSSGYADVPAGERQFVVTPAGATEPKVIDAKATIEKDKSYTIVAYGALANIAPLVIPDDRTAPTAGKARIRVIHASPDAPAVDITTSFPENTPVFTNLSAGKWTEYKEVDPGMVNIVINGAGSTRPIVLFQDIELKADTTYTVVALGTIDTADNYPFGARIITDTGEGKEARDLVTVIRAKLNVVHASPDAPQVDLYIDKGKVGDVEYPKNTGYIDVIPGNREIEVKVTSSGATAIAPVTLGFQPDTSYTLFAIGLVANIEPLRLEDDLTPPAAGKAHVRFVHLSPDAPAVDIKVKDGDILFPNKKFKEFTAFTPVDAGTYDLEVTLAVAPKTVVLPLNGIKLDEGKIYTVFAKGLVAGQGAQALGAEVIIHN